MRTTLISLWCILCFTGITFYANAQHHSEDTVSVKQHETHSMKGAHRLSFGLSHTHVSEGKVDGKTQWLPLASFSLNYDYWLTNRWGIGLQHDLILETFKIENQEGEIIERKTPLSMVPVGLYKFANRWTAILGAGIEFSKEQNLGLTRVGVEYGWHIPSHYELGIALVWDNKWNYYNSWSLAFTLSNIWPKKH